MSGRANIERLHGSAVIDPQADETRASDENLKGLPLNKPAADAHSMTNAGLSQAKLDVSEKVFRRLVWLLFAMFVCSYLDRVNIGYAALSMNKDLGLTATTFGLASTFFYIPYILFEIPSNLLLMRFGARRWLARIMITWGVASAATMFAYSAESLYGLRALVGFAEAGFLPGVLLYMSFWFPASHRGRAMSRFMMAMPATVMVGAPLSGLIVQLNGTFGLAGWRYLFLLEAIPSILVGLLVLRYLPNGPKEARWLSDAEKGTLSRVLAEDEPPPEAKGRYWALLFSPVVALFCLAYFCLGTSLNTYATWSPLVIRETVGATTSALSIGLLAALSAAVTIVAMGVTGTSSDRSGDRLWHAVLLLGATASGWAMLVLADGMVAKFAGLCLASAGAFSGMALFWTLVTPYLPKETRPAAVAMISTAGIFSSAVSPSIIGVLRDLSGSFSAGLWYSAALCVVGAACLFAATAVALPNAQRSHLR